MATNRRFGVSTRLYQRHGLHREHLVEIAAHGFETVEDWARAWQDAARSESFEREVSERVERLCP